MERRHNRKHNHWNNNKNNNDKGENSQYQEDVSKTPLKKFHFISKENFEAQSKRDEAIQEIKSRQLICPKCGEPILDIASAISDKTSGTPMHFECVMNQLNETESVGPNEKICYIGQGRFGILYFENPRDQRHFTIKKIIEWEQRDKKIEWRDEMSGLYSHIE